MKIMNEKKQYFITYSVLLGVMILIALIGPLCMSTDIYTSDLGRALQAPSSDHWFGTDKLGRDVFARIIHGMQLSLGMSFSIVSLMAMTGTLVGVVAGFYGGKVEMVLMRLCDIMISFPGIILAIAIAGVMGGSIGNAILALTLVGWAKYARIVRSLVLKVRGEDYVTAARLSGASPFVIMRRHILPNTLPLVFVTAGMDLGTMILEVAGLSFLGFGAQPPTPEWGRMLNEGRQYLQMAPWLMVFPGVAILLVVTVFNLWSDSLRDILDPKQT